MENKKITNSLNAPIQGTAADLIKLALGRLQRRLAGQRATIICMVHDEIIIEVVESQVDEVKDLLETTMREAGEEFLPSVPIRIDTNIGTSWSSKA